LVEVRYLEDDTFRGYLPVASKRELLFEHVWFTKVAGVSHHPSVGSWRDLGVPAALLREAENPHDPHAISVWIGDGEKVGYIPKLTASDIDDSIERRACVMAEMRVDGVRTSLWLLVSRQALELSPGPFRDDTERRRMEHRVMHLKEEALSALGERLEMIDPTTAMQIMAEALDHDHRGPSGGRDHVV
jgi:hypothetical protein